MFCEAQGKGRAKCRPRKVTKGPFIDQMVDGGCRISLMLSLMLMLYNPIYGLGDAGRGKGRCVGSMQVTLGSLCQFWIILLVDFGLVRVILWSYGLYYSDSRVPCEIEIVDAYFEIVCILHIVYCIVYCILYIANPNGFLPARGQATKCGHGQQV